MRTALDSNILSALWSNEASAKAISRQLYAAKQIGSIRLSPVAYAELFAHPTTDEGFRSRFYRDLDIEIDFELSPAAWTEAGRRFANYASRRRRSGGGEVRRLVPDFAIGAHALIQADRLLTMDADRFTRDFPELSLVPVSA